jgi:hypothetical protein
MPDVSGVTVVTNACAFYTTHAAADAPSVRHSLRPLIGGREVLQQNSGESRREIAKLYPAVIALYPSSLPATNAKRLRKGAIATKQSILS